MPKNKNIFLLGALLSGGLYGFSFFNERLGLLLSLASLVLFFWVLTACRRSSLAFLCGIVFSFVFGLADLYWFCVVMKASWHSIPVGCFVLMGVILVVILPSLMLFTWLLKRIQRTHSPNLLPLAFACAWVASELLQTAVLQGLHWTLLGHHLIALTPLIQIAAFTGVWGLSFWLALIAGFIFALIFMKRSFTKKAKFIYLGVLLVFPLISLIQWFSLKRDIQPQLKVAILHAGIPQEQKWDRSFRETIIGKFSELAQEAQKQSPNLVIWPETSYPKPIERIYSPPRDTIVVPEPIKKLSGTHLISAFTGHFAMYNSSLLIKDGEFLDTYDKVRLLPFGEFLPFAGFMPDCIRGRMRSIIMFEELRPGKIEKVLGVADNARLGVTSCHEVGHARIVNSFVKKGASLLVNLSNDAWFVNTPVIQQQFWANPLAAIEQRLPLVRASNRGISAIIDPLGRISHQIKPDETGVLIGWTHQLASSSKGASFRRLAKPGFLVLIALILLYFLISPLAFRRIIR